MAKYRKMPVIVKAEKYYEGLEDGKIYNIYNEYGSQIQTEDINQFIDDLNLMRSKQEKIQYITIRSYINTLEGKILVNYGDYVVTGVKGERYPVRADIFNMTYEYLEG